MGKQRIESIAEKNRTIDRIIETIFSRDNFLLIGHRNPDEDCIASMVAFGLILSKFSKRASIYIGTDVHDHFQYLLNICKYNAIGILYYGEVPEDDVDTVVSFDTPKRSMVESDPAIYRLLESENTRVIEFDHHIGADSDYIGDDGYRLVTEASSASELVGHFALKLAKRSEILRQYQIDELLSRNVILAMLTGIIGDSKMGQFLKSSRERRYYRLFTQMLNDMLANRTTKNTNFSHMGEIFDELSRLSETEERCYAHFYRNKIDAKLVSYVVADIDESEHMLEEYGNETMVTVARAIADTFAEESGALSLVAYCDDSGLAQFRVRRSKLYKAIDLRELLERFQIADGGGHEGAIGFRFPVKDFVDIRQYAEDIVEIINADRNQASVR